MKIGLLVLALCFLVGCESTEDINKDYKALAYRGEPIDAKEAKTIAQKELINTEEKDSYRVSYPDIKTGPLADKYPDYWFVVFGHNWLEPLNADALESTYTQLRETEYLVVINKKSGHVIFLGEWFPKRENDFDWVFDRNAYNRKDPLTLPPYKVSRELL